MRFVGLHNDIHVARLLCLSVQSRLVKKPLISRGLSSFFIKENKGAVLRLEMNSH